MTEENALPNRIDALLPYLQSLEAATPGDWKGGERDPGTGATQMPWFDYGDEMMAFVQDCYDHQWVSPGFDWPNWNDRQKYEENQELVASADTETITRLLTAHIRGDRFVEGHLAAMVANGHLLAIVRRLAVIRAGL